MIFASQLKEGRNPTRMEIGVAVLDCKELKGRSIPQIKIWLQNQRLRKSQENALLRKIETYCPPENSTNLKINAISGSKSKVKKYFCFYCKKLYSKLVLHLERKHPGKPDVQKFSMLPKGDMIVCRRPKTDLDKNDRDYKTCPSCKGMYSKKFYSESFPKMCAQLEKRFEIGGRKARGVSVLLSKRLLACVDLMLKNWEKAGVLPSNPYIFGIPGESYLPLHLKARDLMRKFAEESRIRNHHLIRGTRVRKQLATKSSVMNLNENVVSDLANFLGHADKIHRDHYRMPVVSREIGRVSRLLEMGLQSNPPLLDHSKHIENNVSPIGHVERTSWSTPEKKSALHLFRSNIETGDLPSLPECLVAIKSYSVLQNKSPAQL
ncbi:hypothetical protein JTB14_021995 [Gonioctena quinquepunctata]|nr:hypothetical protein JTB14_021995 [Gonioctena quinquepunctata]